MSRLLGLEAERVGILKVFHLQIEDRRITKLTGKNAQGKSTALNSLAMLLSTKAVPEEPLQHGASRGKIVGRFETDKGVLIVKKVFTKANPRGELKVFWEGKEDRPLPAPQTVLDELLGLVSFDPLDFCDASPEEQRRMLLDVLGVREHIESLDAQYEHLYKEREGVNREKKALKGYLDKIPDVPETVAISFVDLIDRRQKALEHNLANKEEREKLQKMKDTLEDLRVDGKSLSRQIQEKKELIEKLQNELAELEPVLAEKRDAFSKLSVGITLQEKKVNKLADIDISTYDDQLTSVEEINRNAEIWKARQEALAQYSVQDSHSKDLTLFIRQNREEKETVIKSATMPIEGLEITDEGVRYKGTLVSQISKAQKIIVGCSVLSALNPALRIFLMDDAEKLDSDTMKMVEDWAEKNDLYGIMAMVEESGQVGIVFQDGEVIKDNYAESSDD